MAGHNKWSKIKHRKAVVDKRRGKAWTKISKALIVAARHGGPDPDANLALRYAIDEARYANMPRDTVERAIRKGAGGEDTSNYETIRYEGYGPGGVAVIIDTLTDNRARTVGDIRLAFSDHGGNIGGSGCVAYMFAAKGRVVVAAEGLVEDAVMEKAIEAGATDVEPLDEGDDDHPPSWIIWTEVASFASVKTNVEKAGLPVIDAGLVMVPDNHVAVSGEQADTIAALIEALEDLDDVQKVYSNASFE